MIGLMLATGLACLATMAGLLALSFLLFQWHVRRYNAAVAAQRLDDWALHLDRLGPAARADAQAAPPAAVVAAMAGLPSRGVAGVIHGLGETPLKR